MKNEGENSSLRKTNKEIGSLRKTEKRCRKWKTDKREIVREIRIVKKKEVKNEENIGERGKRQKRRLKCKNG